jgi:hypothetical protein
VRLHWVSTSSGKDGNTTGFLDSLFSSSGEGLSLDDEGDLRELTLSEYLEVALFSFRYIIYFTALVTSITGTLSLFFSAFCLVYSDTRDHNLSTFTVGL